MRVRGLGSRLHGVCVVAIVVCFEQDCCPGLNTVGGLRMMRAEAGCYKRHASVSGIFLKLLGCECCQGSTGRHGILLKSSLSTIEDSAINCKRAESSNIDRGKKERGQTGGQRGRT